MPSPQPRRPPYHNPRRPRHHRIAMLATPTSGASCARPITITCAPLSANIFAAASPISISRVREPFCRNDRAEHRARLEAIWIGAACTIPASAIRGFPGTELIHSLNPSRRAVRREPKRLAVNSVIDPDLFAKIVPLHSRNNIG